MDRERNIYRLRNGIEDFNGIAREILASPFGEESSPPFPAGSTDGTIHIRSDVNRLVSDPFIGELDDGGDNDAAALYRFLGSEDHEILMAQIAEALQEEYFAHLNDNETLLHESQEIQENCYWLQEEAQLSQDENVICPVCRL